MLWPPSPWGTMQGPHPPLVPLWRPQKPPTLPCTPSALTRSSRGGLGALYLNLSARGPHGILGLGGQVRLFCGGNDPLPINLFKLTTTRRQTV